LLARSSAILLATAKREDHGHEHAPPQDVADAGEKAGRLLLFTGLRLRRRHRSRPSGEVERRRERERSPVDREREDGVADVSVTPAYREGR
jgi:hypothetical protein